MAELAEVGDLGVVAVAGEGAEGAGTGEEGTGLGLGHRVTLLEGDNRAGFEGGVVVFAVDELLHRGVLPGKAAEVPRGAGASTRIWWARKIRASPVRMAADVPNTDHRVGGRSGECRRR
jgi:hypothetical protein